MDRGPLTLSELSILIRTIKDNRYKHSDTERKLAEICDQISIKLIAYFRRLRDVKIASIEKSGLCVKDNQKVTDNLHIYLH